MNEIKNNVVNLYKNAIDKETISKSINITILEIKKTRRNCE